MKRLVLLLLSACMLAPAPSLARVTIVRDDWGIAHVHGHTDADAVYGMAYAQAEDDFNRVETNYLGSLGWLAQAEGRSAVYRDLRARLYVNQADLQERYATAPAWLRRLMDAWAGGLNAYLASHPDVHPRVIRHFEPWMALSFTEGSIGGDIERIDLAKLQAFYGGTAVAQAAPSDALPVPDPGGSNGIAIAPSRTRDHHALLLINPHTSFYFRSELQMSSDEGLDAYGAVTWGQFFIYQGFNRHIGWMHTSTSANNVDAFSETIVRRSGRLYYRYGAALRPVQQSTVTVPYRLPDGRMASTTFTVYRTHHGPIVAADGDRWIAEAMMFRPVPALEQSYLRTKAFDYASFRHVALLQANSSNNTVFADDKGEIAYMHPQFIPRRSAQFDYRKPVDGANPATDWQGLFTLDQEPHLLDPASGFIFNTNDGPYNIAGSATPAWHFPAYMDTVGENARGRHALMLLEQRRDLTLDGLRALAFDPHLPFFAALLPSLERAYDALATSDPLKERLAKPIAALRQWDDTWSSDSIPTSLAVFWADALAHHLGHADQETLAAATDADKLAALDTAVTRLTSDYGTWETPWGSINRFQRLDDAITGHFDDAAPSIPVPFVAGTWGSLAAFYAAPAPNTKRWYGSAGNSFVAVVEFGPRVRALAVTAGGESGDVLSPHFDDEALRYSTGNLRTVYFYPDQLRGHISRVYRLR